jgi:hypothetical protein
MDLDNILPFKLDASYLFVSMFWSAIGGGFWLYGKKQRTAPPLFGGIGLIAISWVINSAVWMSLAAIGIIVGVYYWSRHSD